MNPLTANQLADVNLRKDGSPQEHTIAVRWEAPAALNGASAEYKATLSTVGASTNFGDRFSATFDGLTPGTGYTIIVTIKTQANPVYGTLTVEHTTAGDTFYTSKWHNSSGAVCSKSFSERCK